MRRRIRTAKFILPALTEATSPYWRPIKYSLFPPLGLATLAAYLDPAIDVTLVDEHVEHLSLEDEPDLVVIQVYITNAYRSYQIADHYRKIGSYVALGGLHITSLPDEAAAHADSIFLGPGEETFPQFLKDFTEGHPLPRYFSATRTLERLPPIRRSLIKRPLYLVPNSIVVSRGCPHHCEFCYKDAFFEGTRSFYTQRVDDALSEIQRLPGRHLYFLDDHLFGNPTFARPLFDGMRGMGRVFQGAATVDSVLRGDLVEHAAEAGLRSLFVGFESLNPENLRQSRKHQNLGQNYHQAIRRLEDLGVMINGSFVFGLDDDDPDVFRRTVDWALEQGITTATFHILTPYPGTALFKKMDSARRITTYDWDLYDTRHVVYRTRGLSPAQLKDGYDWAYKEFYRWSNIMRGSRQHQLLKHSLKHFFYTAGWKKFEPLWNLAITAQKLRHMRPLLEAVLSKVTAAASEDERITLNKLTQCVKPANSPLLFKEGISPTPTHRAKYLAGYTEKGGNMLHKTSYMVGFHIEATDGGIGHVDDFLVDENWMIRYLVVDTSNWPGGKSVLISFADVDKIDSPQKRIFVKLTREEVANRKSIDTADIKLIETLGPTIL